MCVASIGKAVVATSNANDKTALHCNRSYALAGTHIETSTRLAVSCCLDVDPLVRTSNCNVRALDRAGVVLLEPVGIEMDSFVICKFTNDYSNP